MAHSREKPAVSVDAAELDFARDAIAQGEAVRMLLPGGRTALCTTLDDVRAVQRGKIPQNAVRLDGRAR